MDQQKCDELEYEEVLPKEDSEPIEAPEIEGEYAREKLKADMMRRAKSPKEKSDK